MPLAIARGSKASISRIQRLVTLACDAAVSMTSKSVFSPDQHPQVTHVSFMSFVPVQLSRLLRRIRQPTREMLASPGRATVKTKTSDQLAILAIGPRLRSLSSTISGMNDCDENDSVTKRDHDWRRGLKSRTSSPFKETKNKSMKRALSTADEFKSPAPNRSSGGPVRAIRFGRANMLHHSNTRSSCGLDFLCCCGRG